jgi:hypothetical protein
MIIFSEWRIKRIWKQTVAAYLKYYAGSLPGETEENHETPQ